MRTMHIRENIRNNFRKRFRTGVLIGALAVGFQVAPLVGSHSVSAAEKAKPAYPKLNVTDLSTGKPFDLSTLAKTDRATLVWFWAPH
jgi:hypothetical protein